jgi:hypothetical protein
MALQSIQQGDINTTLQITVEDGGVVVNITGGTGTMYLLPPDGSVKTLNSISIPTGTDGIMTKVTVSGDIDEPGLWRIQGKVVLGASTLFTKLGRFRVLPSLI